MSYYLEVLLKLFNILTKIFGFNEFIYDRRRNKMLSCRPSRWYMAILHYLVVWPVSLAVIASIIPWSMKKLTLAYMLIRLGVYITVSRHMASAAMGWYIMHYRRELCRLLNQFLRLAKMHREIFRRDVHVPWLWLLIHFMRELYLAFYFTPFSVGFGGSLNFVTARLPFLFVLLDVGLMIHHNMIRSLAEHYDELSHSRDLKRACLEYFEQLVQLKPKLQQFCWISTLARLSIEMMLTMMLCLIEFWMHYMPGNKIYLISIIIECALMSNMLSNIRVARSIELMESKILHHLYQDEILFSLKHLKATRNWRMEKLELIHLKRCTKNERCVSILNYIYVLPALVLYVVDFIFCNVFLMMTFSIK